MEEYSPDKYHFYQRKLKESRTLDLASSASQRYAKRKFLVSLGVIKIRRKPINSPQASVNLMTFRAIQLIGRMERYLEAYRTRFEQDAREGNLPEFYDGDQTEFQFRDSSWIGRPADLSNRHNGSRARYIHQGLVK